MWDRCGGTIRQEEHKNTGEQEIQVTTRRKRLYLQKEMENNQIHDRYKVKLIHLSQLYMINTEYI